MHGNLARVRTTQRAAKLVECGASGVARSASFGRWHELRRPHRRRLPEIRGRATSIRLERAVEARLGVESGVERDLQKVSITRPIRQLGSHRLNSQPIHELVEALAESFV